MAVSWLGAFTVREVPGSVADGKSPVKRSIPGAKARAAERAPYGSSRYHQVADGALIYQVDKYCLGRRIYGKGELVVAAGLAF